MNAKIRWAAIILAMIGFLTAYVFFTLDRANAVQGSDKDDTSHAVTVGEFYSVKKGMTRQEVVQLLDGPGHAGQKHTRWYRWEGSGPRFVRFIVTYHNNRVTHGYLVAKKANHGTFDVPVNKLVRTNADTRKCITNSEWARIAPGMTRHDVREVLDGDGTKGPSVGVRDYTICDKDPSKIYAVVWYRDGGHIMDGGLWIQVSQT